MNTQELQQAIVSLKEKMGWSYDQLADVLSAALSDDEVAEPRPTVEQLKKQLQRKTTSTELLDEYLCVLSRDDRVQKSQMVVPIYCENDEISGDFLEGMKQLSKQISEDLESQLKAGNASKTGHSLRTSH